MTTFFFFSSRRRHTRYWRDWSSDVCSSDLKDDIERMMRDAEAHAEEDKRRREEAETRNLAESLQYQTEKFLAENGEKIPADKKEELGEALTELRSSLGGSDIAAIKAAQEKVARVSQEVGGALYAQQ